MNQYWVYIMANQWNTTLYTGVTNDLERRVHEHQVGVDPRSFTARYHTRKLVWYEEHNDIHRAISREKQLKNWKRDWKNALVSGTNPTWQDLSEDWK
ncbi:MAG TPA: GIY-YIG nuclease family protein [Flavobacteriales bacterium]